MLHLPISRSWLVSLTARRVYLACALLTLALIATSIGVHMAMSVAGAGALTPVAATLVKMLLYPEILAAALLWIAMWYFWFGFDASHHSEKSTVVCALGFLSSVRNSHLLFRRLSPFRFVPAP